MRLLDKKLEEKFNEKLAPLSGTIIELRDKVEDVMNHIQFVNAKFDDITKNMDALAEENKVLKNTLRSLEASIQSVAMDLNDLELYGRRECIEIRGIPPPRVALQETDDTNDIAVQVGELMGVTIEPEDISVSHRLKISQNYIGRSAKEPPIIVKFTRRDVKEKFYRARGQLCLKTTSDLGYVQDNKIYIAESLTELNKKLFNRCLNVRREKAYQFLWTSNGRIYMRKDKDSRTNIIASPNDLLKLP